MEQCHAAGVMITTGGSVAVSLGLGGGGAVSRSWGNDYYWGQCSSITRTGGSTAVYV